MQEIFKIHVNGYILIYIHYCYPYPQNCEITQNCLNRHNYFKTKYMGSTVGHYIDKMCEYFLTPLLKGYMALFVWSHAKITSLEMNALLPKLVSRWTLLPLWHQIRNTAHGYKFWLLPSFKRLNTLPLYCVSLVSLLKISHVLANQACKVKDPVC